MPVRRPFPLYNQFRPFVIEELIRRKNNYPQPTSSPFVRMTASTADPVKRYKFFSLGLHGYPDPKSENIFDTIYGKRQDIVGYAYSTDTTNKDGFFVPRLIDASELTIQPPEFSPEGVDANQLQRGAERILTQQSKGIVKGTHPIPGITSMTVDTSNPSTPLSIEIEWKCYNRNQLEFLRHQFMIIGSHVIIEWGHMFSDKRPQKMLNFGKQDIENELTDIIVEGRKYVIDNYVEPNEGMYDIVVGIISNFNVTFDPHTNVYTCHTSIKTAGEQLLGIFVHQTFVNHTTSGIAAGKISNISDFFALGGIFDSEINSSKDGKEVARLTSDFKSISIATANDLGQGQSNAAGYTFISWEFFTKKIIPKIFAVIDNPLIRNDLQSFVNFYANADDKIGDSPFLRSTNPNIMLIVRKLNMINVPDVLTPIGYFDEIGGGKYGSLNKGIWINVNAIREVFLQSSTFVTAIKSLLTRMNSATAGFWNLDIYYEDENASYKVVDYAYGELTDFPSVYRFNVGATGETLGIELESSFPPEVIAMLSMVAKFKSESPQNQLQLIKDYPLIGTTTHYGYMLNWTNLTDVLEPLLAKKRSEIRGIDPDKILAFAPGKGVNQTEQLRDANRIIGTINGFLNPTNTPTSPAPGQSLKEVLGSLTTPPKPQPEIRSSLDPIPNKTVQDALAKGDKYKTIMGEKARKYGIDPDLLMALAYHESRFNPVAIGKAIKAGNADDHGLMQINLKTARGLRPEWKSWSDTMIIAELQKPEVNIDLAADLLSRNFADARLNGDVQQVLSAYNGGIRPSLGFGVPFATTGRFGNQDYVNSVAAAFNQVKIRNGTPTLPNAPQYVQQNPAPNTTSAGLPSEQTPSGKIEEKFGTDVLLLIENNPSRMLSMITNHGINQTPPTNNLIAPYPTTAKVQLTLLGISGFSLADIFVVDKLPFIFDNYGCFQITRIRDSVTERGWVTILEGIFKFIWFDGSGPKNNVW